MQTVQDIVIGFAATTALTGIGLLIAFVFASRANARARREMRQKLRPIKGE